MLVAVSTNTKVDFAGVLIRFEGLGDAWQYVKQRCNSIKTRCKGSGGNENTEIEF